MTHLAGHLLGIETAYCCNNQCGHGCACRNCQSNEHVQRHGREAIIALKEQRGGQQRCEQQQC